jgi:ATP-dependent helicase IRC3
VRHCLILNTFADETTESLEKRAAEFFALDSTDDIPEPRSVTYKDYDDPFSLVNQGSGAPQIAKISRHAWVGCGGDVYVLECLGKGFVRIEPVEGTPRLRFPTRH